MAATPIASATDVAAMPAPTGNRRRAMIDT